MRIGETGQVREYGQQPLESIASTPVFHYGGEGVETVWSYIEDCERYIDSEVEREALLEFSDQLEKGPDMLSWQNDILPMIDEARNSHDAARIVLQFEAGPSRVLLSPLSENECRLSFLKQSLDYVFDIPFRTAAYRVKITPDSFREAAAERRKTAGIMETS